jgi:papain like cysteine protease AvrRpt2
MLFRYNGFGTTQCQTLSLLYNFDCCFAPQFCLTGAPIDLIQRALLNLGGLRSVRRFAALSPAEIRTEIDSGRPLIMAYSQSFSGHVVVVYGYESGGQILQIHDPAFGTFRVPYALTFSYGGSMVWIDTIYRISR